MNVFVFSGPGFQSLAKDLIQLNWLGEYGGWFWNDLVAISSCTEGMGLEPKKISESCAADGEKIILVEGNLAGMSQYWQSPDKKSIVFSVSGYVGNPKYIPAMIRRIEAFTTLAISCINPTCACSNGYLGVGLDVCDDCQSEMADKGMVNNAIRLLAISSLEKQGSRAESYYQTHIGHALKDFGIFTSNPLVIVKSTRFIIDSMTETDSSVRKWLGKISREISDEKSNIKGRYRSSWTRNDQMPPFLIASRRWNSWTPNQPNKEDSKVLHYKTGGGYFISDGKTNIALDPGYGFLDMLYAHGFSVTDIDCIIVSHDHPDHLAEFENILGLRYNYAAECANNLTILLNQSSYFLLNRISKYYKGLLSEGSPTLLKPGSKVTVGQVEIEAIDMFHDEIYSHITDAEILDEISTEVGSSKSLGFKFRLVSSDGFPIKIVIPGDTSFPNTEDGWRRLLQFYGGADIAAIHLGSLESGWTDGGAVGSSIRYRENGHLGLNGAIQMIKLINPKIAVLTEFGEELDTKDLRMSLVEIIKQAVVATRTKVIPSDISLFIVHKGGQFLGKCRCGHYIPTELINSSCAADKSIIYDYSPGCQSELSHIKEIEVFPFVEPR